jgi:hypothetical protein
MGGGAVQSAEQQLDNALEEERDSGDLVAQHDYTDITSYFKDDGSGNPSVGETLDGCTVLDSSQFGGKTAAQWIAGLSEEWDFSGRTVTNFGGSDGSISSGSGTTATVSNAAAGSNGSHPQFGKNISFAVGDTYWVSVDCEDSTKLNNVWVGGANLPISSTSVVGIVTVTSATGGTGVNGLMLETNGTSVWSQEVTISVKHLPGNHTVASGTGPTLRQTSGMHYTETNGTDDALTMAIPSGHTLTDMMVSIAFRTSDLIGYLVNSQSSSYYLGRFHDGASGTALHNNSGAPTMRLDGSPWAPATRDEMHQGVSDSVWHVVTVEGSDLSNWSEIVLGFLGAASSGNTAYDIVGLVIAPNTAENIELAEAALAKAMEPVGYALAA